MFSPCFLAVSAANAGNWENTIKESSFISDSELELTTINMWKYLKTENRFDKQEQRYRNQVANAWGQNFQADFRSGYLGGILGFDVSLISRHFSYNSCDINQIPFQKAHDSSS